MTRIIRCNERGQVCAGYHTSAHKKRKNRYVTRKGRIRNVITVSRVGQGRGIRRRRRAVPTPDDIAAPW